MYKLKSKGKRLGRWHGISGGMDVQEESEYMLLPQRLSHEREHGLTDLGMVDPRQMSRNDWIG